MIRRNNSPREGNRATKAKTDLGKPLTGMRCEVCGNDYDKMMEIVVNGISHHFDSFECAIQALAPKCDHCGCRILGHGMEAGGTLFCCAHCAREKGVTSVKDRVSSRDA